MGGTYPGTNRRLALKGPTSVVAIWGGRYVQFRREYLTANPLEDEDDKKRLAWQQTGVI